MSKILIFLNLFLIPKIYGFVHNNNGTLSFPWYPKCASFTSKTPHIPECCPSASFGFSLSDRHFCSQECLEDGGEACCYDNCFADRLEIYVDEKINYKAFVSALMNGKEDVIGLQKLAEDAVKECEANWDKKYPFAKEYENSQTCDMPDKLYMVSKCILSFVFSKCPDYNQDPKCNDLKKMMENCDELTTTISPPPTDPPSTTTPVPTMPPTLPPTTTVETTIVTTTSAEVTTGSLNETTTVKG